MRPASCGAGILPAQCCSSSRPRTHFSSQAVEAFKVPERTLPQQRTGRPHYAVHHAATRLG